MIISNKVAISLVELLKSSKKLDQTRTMVSFNEDGSRCSITLVWKRSKKCLYNADASTVGMYSLLDSWWMMNKI